MKETIEEADSASYDKTLVPIDVGMNGCGEARSSEYGCCGLGQRSIHLSSYDAAGLQSHSGYGSYGSVETQRVGSRGKECNMRFVLQHMSFHLAGFGRSDVGRVAHDDISHGELSGKQLGLKHVGLQPCDRGTESLRVTACHGEGIGTDIHTKDSMTGIVEGEGDGYASAASAEVYYGAGTGGMLAAQSHKALGLGARDEARRRDGKAAVAEEAMPHYVLHRLACHEACRHFVQPLALGWHKSGIFAHQHIRQRQPKTVLHHHTRYGTCLRAAIAWRESSNK